VVEELVRRGLVERKRMDSDRRTYRLNVTPAGKKILTTLTRCARRHERNLDHVIGARDRKRFIQILKKIAAEIE
jgi:DNA-binding MarR family transcriptional regulator